MNHVFLYVCVATFDGSSDCEYEPPEKGQTVDCLLFLLQESEDENLRQAQNTLKKFGLGKCEDITGHPVHPSMLRTGALIGMDDQYIDALNNGFSLVWDAIE